MPNDEFDTFCYNLDLFLFNINDLNPTCSVIICDFNARTSKLWSSDKEPFEGHAVVLTTSAGCIQLTDQPTHEINSSSC